MNITIDPTIKSNNVCEKIVGARSVFARMILERYNEGLSVKQLIEEFGVNKTTIFVLLKKAEEETGIKRQQRTDTKKRMSQEQLETAAYLLNHGWSMAQTAKKIGVYYRAIQSRIQTGSLPPSRNFSTIFKGKKLMIKKLEERINRMERMATHGIY